jgi:hypothetical protein
MRFSRAAVVLLTLFLSQGNGTAYPVQGLGATSCGAFAKMYQGDPDGTENMFFMWAQGFMSSWNMSVMAAKNTPRELAGQLVDQKRALRTFCAENPLKNYMDGVLELYGKLPYFRENSN